MGKKLSEMTLEELWELFPIILKKHNPEYKNWYRAVRDEILQVLDRDLIKRMNHIGSSAVQGLVSKPTVDILLEIDEKCDIDKVKQKLKADGWGLMSFSDNPELNMSFNKGYTEDGFAEKVFHLHVRFLGDWNELYFRDYLITHKEIAREYENLKLELKEKYEHNRDAYTEAKTEFIKKYTNEARKEFGNRYLPE